MYIFMVFLYIRDVYKLFKYFSVRYFLGIVCFLLFMFNVFYVILWIDNFFKVVELIDD